MKSVELAKWELFVQLYKRIGRSEPRSWEYGKAAKWLHNDFKLWKDINDKNIHIFVSPVDGVLDKKALVLYFENDQDRDEFIEAVQEAKPGMKVISV